MKRILTNAWFWFGIFLIALFLIVRYVFWPIVDSNMIAPLLEPAQPVTTTKTLYLKEPIIDNLEYMNTLSTNCQYIDRYNADGTCDNSDPACPETLKDPKLRGNC